MKKTTLLFSILVLLASPCQAANSLTVVRVIDGDTLQLSDGQTVSLIGIQPSQDPEQGKEAVEFTRKLVEGKQVRLEYDVKKQDNPIVKRTLAYVFIDTKIPEDAMLKGWPWGYHVKHKDHLSEFINAEIILAGYAQVMTVPPNVKYQELFVKLEKEARENKNGFWSGSQTGGGYKWVAAEKGS